MLNLSRLDFTMSPYAFFLIVCVGIVVADGSTSALTRSKECVIVGSGPMGLAAALTLSNPPHCYNVIVLDRASNVDEYNPAMAYHFGINPRGLAWFDSLPKVAEKLAEIGSFPTNGVATQVIVPADPSEAIPPSYLMRRAAKGKHKKRCYIQRQSLVRLLYECCIEQERERLEAKNASTGSIQILHGKTVDFVDSDGDDILKMNCADGCTYSASLVVGADGIDSTVRSILSDKAQTGWLHSNPGQFTVKKYKTPSTGMTVKTLQFAPGMSIPNTTDSSIVMETETYYSIQGVNTGRNDRISLGFFPMKDPKMSRPATFATRRNHEVWSRQTGPAIKDFFVKAFPRINFDGVVSDKEWDRLAKSNGTTFPCSQYTPCSVLASPSRETGVVLVGDACHAFPPDCGQGVNAGFQDIAALDRALRGQDILNGRDLVKPGKKLLLGDALHAYQKNRGPEHKALVQLSRYFAPYQYKLHRRRDEICAFFWSINVKFRGFLNKATFGLFPTAVYFIGQNYDLTFREVMFRANIGTLALQLLVCIALVPFFVKRFRLV